MKEEVLSVLAEQMTIALQIRERERERKRERKRERATERDRERQRETEIVSSEWRHNYILYLGETIHNYELCQQDSWIGGIEISPNNSKILELVTIRLVMRRRDDAVDWEIHMATDRQTWRQTPIYGTDLHTTAWPLGLRLQNCRLLNSGLQS